MAGDLDTTSEKLEKGIVIIFLLTLLSSCEKPASSEANSTEKSQQSSAILAAAQLSHAKTHLSNRNNHRALAYLNAAFENNPDPEIRQLVEATLETTHFTVPILRLIHPYPILQTATSGKDLFVALSGPYPTVIRWSMDENPKVSAVLFPIEAKTISHLVVSPSGKFLLAQRDSTNLLCDAESLKPIDSIGTFPPGLDPVSLQVFSENSLLLAHPTTSPNNTLTWHIRDTATGEILRSEVLPAYPPPSSSRFDGNTLAVSFENGSGIFIPLTGETERNNHASKTAPPSPTSNFSISGNLLDLQSEIQSSSTAPISALTGYQIDPETQSLSEVPVPDRLQVLSEFFPEIPSTFQIFSAQTPVENRLAAAFPHEFPEISSASRTHADIIRDTFASDDRKSLLAAIEALPPSGLPTATALFLAHQSNNPDILSAVLARAKNVPAPLLEVGRPGTRSPDFATLRKTQDWIGYESPDFSPIFRNFSEKKTTTLSSLILPETPTEEDVQTFLQTLLTEETLQQIGRDGVSEAALNAADALSQIQEHATSAINLTAIAERSGAPVTKLLRIRAYAFTTLADFKSAHENWLQLINNHPQARHLPSDYSEAAYTAFENSDSRQAIEILDVGLFRFPHDVDLAIRSGQIALLTAHPEKAQKYLTRATKIGLPPSDIENTTALLAIAHSDLGDPETGRSYFTQLTAIDPSWADPESIEKLPWPEGFKQTLLGIISYPSETEPGLPLENDPTDTVPPFEELEMLEPPLPTR